MLTDAQVEHLYRRPQAERVEAAGRGGRPGPAPPAREVPADYRPDRDAYVRTCAEFMGWPPERAGAAWDAQWGGK